MLATVARVLESDARPLVSRAGVSSRLAEVIARCMQKAPADRFGSAAVLLGALLYIGGATDAWQLKEWVETPATVAIVSRSVPRRRSAASCAATSSSPR